MRFPSKLIALSLSLASAATACLAQTVPAYLPTRDVAVTYQVRSKDRGQENVVARWSAFAEKARIEAGPIYVLADPRTRQATLVMQSFALRLPPGDRTFAYLPDEGTRFVRGPAASVAGYRCTNWTVSSSHGSGTACITDDGVILRGTAADRNGHGGAIEAVSVSYGPQPPALFEVPQGAMSLQAPPGGKLNLGLLKR